MGIQAEKSFAQNEIFFRNLWKSSPTAIRRNRAYRYRLRFVDGGPVHEHLLEAPSTRTGRNGMVRETTLMLNWTVNLAWDSPPTALSSPLFRPTSGRDRRGHIGHRSPLAWFMTVPY